MSRFDLRGHKWNKVRKKRKPTWPSRSTDPLQRTETVAIGLHARRAAGSFKGVSAS
jgi:hypothetical protein